MKMLRLLVLLIAILAMPSPALAWWEYGHETVARVAWLEANPHTRAEIRRLLARSNLLETPTCPARTIEQASIWPDCIKTLQDRFSYASPWHYQNVDVCRPFDQQAPAGTAIACRPRSSATPACSPTAACRCASG